MKLAILGGSFNPVHIGHLFLADTALATLGYERVILIPAYQSPFKLHAQGGSPKDRVDMLSASIAGDPGLTVDDAEIKRKGVSYTIDTLRDIISRYTPHGKPGLILGDDLARDFPQWKQAADIIALVDIIIAHRVTLNEAAFPYAHKRLNNEIVAISSAQIRDLIRNRGAWRYLVPPGARHIIEERGLYGFSDSSSVPSTPSTRVSPSLVAAVEEAARALVSPARFWHSRNTALLSRDLCLRFGMDPMAGYLAGISHDICKSMEDRKMIALAEQDGEPVSKLERKKPALLHARAGAVLLKERFGVTDKDILEAVRFHTLGDAGMGDLAKAVYVADKIELSREGVDPKLRDPSAAGDLNLLFAAVLDNTVAYLKSRELEISESTLRMLEAIQKRDVR
ncbi:MAG: nicotinate (nicotinamide) nucleotide adenylyltransferase [Spirochaetaceae bacterium]|nr:nicotinate (nicotinamide) nucleotide adenylyltransferase [Spirochaetaceae bacterium]